MPWIRPTSHEDPGDGWRDEEFAYDDDVATFATGEWCIEGADTFPVYFKFPPGRYTEIRIFVAMPQPSGFYWLELWFEGKYKATKQKTVAPGMDWYSWKFEERDVDEVRVWLGCNTTTGECGRLGEIIMFVGCGYCPPLAGPLSDFSNSLFSICQFWSDLSEEIEGVAIVGDFLAQPFMDAAMLFRTAGRLICEFSQLLQDLLDDLAGGMTWDALLALIQEHAPGLYAIITDPIGYITNIINDILPDLPDWLDDPIGWLKSTLEVHAPVLYYFWTDPLGEVLYLIGQVFELTPYETQSPEFIVKSLFERYFPELYRLWRWISELFGIYDHEGWLGVINELKRQFYDLAEHALRFLWEGEW